MVSKLYVGNLGSGAAKHEIESAFVKFGPLRNVWVARNPPGFAFVEYDDPRDAEDAVRALDGTRMCGTRVRVEMSNGRSRRGGRRGPPPQRALRRLLRHLFKAIDHLVHQNFFPLYCLSVRIVRQIGLATTYPFTAPWEGIKSCASTPASNQIYSPSLTTAQPSNPIPTCGPP